MSNKARTMLILSCVFITIALLILAYDAYMSIGAYTLLFSGKAENFGEALGKAFGGLILYAMTILCSIGTILFAGVTLPFDIVLLKENGKKWYSITTLVVAIVCLDVPPDLPIISEAQSAANASSSSDPATSEALLLL